MDTRELVLAEARQNLEALLLELRDLDAERLMEPFAGTWSAREILIHLGGWYDMLGQAYERMARGERPSPEGVNLGDTDGMNARYVEDATGRSVAAVRNELEVGLARFEAAALALPADRFEEGKTAMRMLKTTAGHPLEHLEDVRAWKAGH